VDQSWGSAQSFKKINHGPIKVTPSQKKKKKKKKKKIKIMCNHNQKQDHAQFLRTGISPSEKW
jgi:hypothetical protein